jgi:glycosyltransferase involved in cell wall biosynthesis
MPDDEIRKQGRRTLLFVTSAFSYGGSEKHLLELLNRIEDDEVQSVILCIDSDPYTERLIAEGRVGVTIRSQRLSKSVKDWLSVFREIKPDIVVLVYGTLWLLPWAAAAAAKLAGIPKLYAIQHLIPVPPPEPKILEIKTPYDIVRRVFGKRVRRILSARIPANLCNKTICVSDAVRDSLVEKYRFPARRMLTIHNGVSPRDFFPCKSEGMAIRSRLGIRRDEVVLVCTARLSPEKGIDILLSALGRVAGADPACKCIIIGDGYLEEKLQAQAKELGLERRVFFVGFQKDVRPYLNAADAFVLTSYVEGLPFSVLEAMACGLPCLVTSVGGNAEAVAHNVNGLVVNPGSVEEVTQGIRYLMTHAEERAEMALVSRSRAENQFDIETRMAELKQLILS